VPVAVRVAPTARRWRLQAKPFDMKRLGAKSSTTIALILVFSWGSSVWAQSADPSGSFPSRQQDDLTDVKGALQDSIRLLVMQHLFRIGFQDKTRRELGGPFFADYARSLRLPARWSDGDGWFTNNIEHPYQGAATGFIWLNNSKGGQLAITMDRAYWSSRLAATAFAAAYSLQFEIGPLSEASIGNVGLNPRTVGWTDHVMTPVGGLIVMVGEDAIDQFVLRHVEQRIHSGFVCATVRMLLNPARSGANVAALQAPWHRAGRPCM